MRFCTRIVPSPEGEGVDIVNEVNEVNKTNETNKRENRNVMCRMCGVVTSSLTQYFLRVLRFGAAAMSIDFVRDQADRSRALTCCSVTEPTLKRQSDRVIEDTCAFVSVWNGTQV